MAYKNVSSVMVLLVVKMPVDDNPPKTNVMNILPFIERKLIERCAFFFFSNEVENKRSRSIILHVCVCVFYSSRREREKNTKEENKQRDGQCSRNSITAHHRM